MRARGSGRDDAASSDNPRRSHVIQSSSRLLEQAYGGWCASRTTAGPDAVAVLAPAAPIGALKAARRPPQGSVGIEPINAGRV
ncbi:two-component system response regulator (plasmid) [Sphingopyxis macrogoltabida]|nr:two-component system response regulator [Sphingopyxis macrogoltabida]